MASAAVRENDTEGIIASHHERHVPLIRFLVEHSRQRIFFEPDFNVGFLVIQQGATVEHLRLRKHGLKG
jgi:hypothetical protein